MRPRPARTPSRLTALFLSLLLMAALAAPVGAQEGEEVSEEIVEVVVEEVPAEEVVEPAPEEMPAEQLVEPAPEDVSLPLLPLPAPEAAPAPAPLPNAEIRAQVLALTNQHRVAAGLAPLRENNSLSAAAQRYAEAMANTSCFAHDCQPVPNFADRLVNAGYARNSFMAENIAMGQPTAAAVVDGWMKSEGHRQNIMNPNYKDLGVGAMRDARGQWWWVQNFGGLP